MDVHLNSSKRVLCLVQHLPLLQITRLPVTQAIRPASSVRNTKTQQALFQAQPPLVQRFLEAQARAIADALVQRLPQVRFSLPDRVIGEAGRYGEPRTLTVPTEDREQMAGGLIDRLTRTDLRAAIRQRLSELEQSNHRAVAVSAHLIRHATATYMVRSMLPSGRSVTYVAAEGEEIPTIPVTSDLEAQIRYHRHHRCRRPAG